MGVQSGIQCVVNGVASMAGWKTRDTNNAPSFSTSDIPGGTGGAAGNSDFNGGYRAYGHTPLFWPGDSIDFKGTTVDGSNGVSATGIVDAMDIRCNVEAGKLIEHTVYFSNNDSSGLVYGTPTADEGATPTIYSSILRKVAWGGSDVNIRDWRLRLLAANRPYVDTSTNGWVMRRPGNIQGQWAYNIYEDNGANFPTRGDIQTIQFYVTDSEYWELQWGLVTQVGDWVADHEGARNVYAPIQGVWSGQDGTSIGSITNPAGAVKWEVT